MRARWFIGVLVVAALVSALAVTAFADGTLSVTADKQVVTYPKVAKLTVTTPAAMESTVAIEARPVDGVWTVVKSIPASQAALGTTFTVVPKLKVTSGLRAVQNGVESEVVTVSVKAKLSPLQVTSKKGKWTVKGFISPAHPRDTVTIKVWKKTVSGKGKKAVTTLTPLDDLTATVYRTKGQRSWFKTTFTRPASGTYVFKAYHADAGHVESSSKSKTVSRKK